jgi:hypothetical protein
MRRRQFCVWAERTSPYYLTVGMRGRQFSSLLAASFCVEVARNGLTHSAVLFPLHFLSFAQVCPSHSSRALTLNCPTSKVLSHRKNIFRVCRERYTDFDRHYVLYQLQIHFSRLLLHSFGFMHCVAPVSLHIKFEQSPC